MCHRPDQSSGGWSSASTAYIHGIHGGAKRTVPFTWHTSNLGDETGNANAFVELTYPGILRNCLQCHLPNTVNFGTGTATNSSNAKWAYENGKVPYYTVGQNKYLTAQTYNGYTYNAASGVCATSTTATTVTAAADAVTSPYVAKGLFASTTDYGPGFAYNFGAVAGTASCTNSGVVLPGLAPGATREAADTTLVNSPIANACFGCHTTPVAMSHMRSNGGYLYASRATVKAANGGTMAYTEQCIVCHGAGRVADAEAIHLQTMK
jgi:OmcA/MtrC family decaheme c-type cytochrome